MENPTLALEIIVWKVVVNKIILEEEVVEGAVTEIVEEVEVSMCILLKVTTCPMVNTPPNHPDVYTLLL